jgi:hypothetical protein
VAEHAEVSIASTIVRGPRRAPRGPTFDLDGSIYPGEELPPGAKRHGLALRALGKLVKGIRERYG